MLKSLLKTTIGVSQLTQNDVEKFVQKLSCKLHTGRAQIDADSHGLLQLHGLEWLDGGPTHPAHPTGEQQEQQRHRLQHGERETQNFKKRATCMYINSSS